MRQLAGGAHRSGFTVDIRQIEKRGGGALKGLLGQKGVAGLVSVVFRNLQRAAWPNIHRAQLTRVVVRHARRIVDGIYLQAADSALDIEVLVNCSARIRRKSILARVS